MIEITNTTKNKINEKRIIAISDAFIKKFKPEKTDVSWQLSATGESAGLIAIIEKLIRPPMFCLFPALFGRKNY